MRTPLTTEALPGFEPEIGRWMWALEEVRRRTLRAVEGLDAETLDWQGPDGRENAIGSLLYHIGLVEMSWLYLDVFERPELPPQVRAEFPFPMATEGRVTAVPGVPLAEHVGRLAWSRRRFLDEVRGMSPDDWHRPRTPGDESYSVTPAWAVFHLVEHEAGHAAQIGALRARAERRNGGSAGTMVSWNQA